jgi:hypothetical protein
MAPSQELEAAIRELREDLAAQSSINIYALVGEKKDRAHFLALQSIVRELAGHAGIHPQRFLKHYLLRQTYFHDRLLRRLEDQSPSLAARIDARDQEQVPLAEGYPPLFSPKHPENPNEDGA